MGKITRLICFTAVLCGVAVIGYFSFVKYNEVNTRENVSGAEHRAAIPVGSETEMTGTDGRTNASAPTVEPQSHQTGAVEAANPSDGSYMPDKMTMADIIENLKNAARAKNRNGIQKYTTLVSRRGDAAIPYLEEMLDDTDTDVRKMGIYMLGLMKRAEFEDRFIGFLKDDDQYIRAVSINMLVRIRSKKALPAIEEMLVKDESSDVRLAAQNAVTVLKKQ